jgi:DNA-binding IclR family transcriptional regulator
MSKKTPAVERSIAILNLLAREPADSYNMSQISRMLGLTKSTTHGILTTLSETGYVIRHDDMTYSLGPALITLGDAAADQNKIVAIAAKEMQRLVSDERVDCVLAAVAGESILVLRVEKAQPGQRLVQVSRPNNLLPLAPPYGSVYVAWDKDRRERWLDSIETVIDGAERERYETILRAVRLCGYAVLAWGEARQQAHDLMRQMSRPEYIGDVRRLVQDVLSKLPLQDRYSLTDLQPGVLYRLSSIAAPIFSRSGQADLALSFEFPPESELGAREVKRLGDRLRESAERISTAAGARWPLVSQADRDADAARRRSS